MLTSLQYILSSIAIGLLSQFTAIVTTHVFIENVMYSAVFDMSVVKKE